MYNFKDGYYADVRIEDRFTTVVKLCDGETQQRVSDSVKKAFIRVYDGKMWYYTSTDDVDGVQQCLDGLYAVAESNPKIASDETVKRFEVNVCEVKAFAENDVRRVPISEKAAVAAECCRLKRAEVLQIVSAYSDRHSEYEFYSSKGANIKYDVQTVRLLALFSLSGKGERVMAFAVKSGTAFSDVVGSVREVEERLDEKIASLGAPPAKPGEFPVVLAPGVAGVFAHESFGHKSEADFMIGDENMAKEWVIGKKVASDILSITDCGGVIGGGYAPFDDDGTRARKNYLIKDGTLTGRLHSCRTAAALSEPLTGNARAMNADFEPIVRMTNTRIESGTSTLEELIAGIDYGYFIKSCKHGSGMSVFTIAPDLCYRIEHGQITEPVNISVVTGNVFETLSLIDGISAENRMEMGYCGKMEQMPLEVGMGGPYVRVSKMTVQ